MLLDSEPEAEPATAKRLALGGFWRRCYTGEYDGEVLWRIAPEFLTVGLFMGSAADRFSQVWRSNFAQIANKKPKGTDTRETKKNCTA